MAKEFYLKDYRLSMRRFELLGGMLAQTPSILPPGWMLIGRQERTAFYGFVGLLAIAPDGALVLVELKRDKTPREIVEQGLDYAAWVPPLHFLALAVLKAELLFSGQKVERGISRV